MDDEDFAPCTCHTGIMWDVAVLNDDGTCPMNDWQNEQEMPPEGP